MKEIKSVASGDRKKKTPVPADLHQRKSVVSTQELFIVSNISETELYFSALINTSPHIDVKMF